jgi:threonine/homoserine/homoserine lactone efflux protein
MHWGALLWLAYHVATAPPLSAQSSSSDAPSLAGGLLLGAANPKAWLAIAAVFAAVELADAASVDAAAKAAVLTVMIVVINAGWLIAGASLAPLLREPRRARMINTALAITLVGATAYATVP